MTILETSLFIVLIGLFIVANFFLFIIWKLTRLLYKKDRDTEFEIQMLNNFIKNYWKQFGQMKKELKAMRQNAAKNKDSEEN